MSEENKKQPAPESGSAGKDENRIFACVYAGPDYFARQSTPGKGMQGLWVDPASAPAQPAKKKNHFCNECGSLLIPPYFYCPECGAKNENVPGPEEV